MPSQSQPLSDRDFSTYAHPLLFRRFVLALVFAGLPVLFGLWLIYDTGGRALIFVIFVPVVMFLFWFSSRVFFAQMLGNSVVVSDVNYPRINTLAEELKVKLGHPKPVHIFVYEQGSFNAYMRFLFFRRAIFLNSELLETGVSDNEVRWIVGRFIGYLRAREQAGLPGWVIRGAERLLVFNVFLFPYERAMVYTGDRLAVAAMDGDISSAASAMQKVFVGRQLGYSVNPEGIIDQQRKIKGTFFGFMARLPSHFPHMTARYVDLIVFAKVFFPAEFAKFESANPGLPADLIHLATGATSVTGVPLRPAPAPMTQPAPTPVTQPTPSPARTQPSVPAYMRPSPSKTAQPASPQPAAPSPIVRPAATSPQQPQSPSTAAAPPPPTGFSSAPQVSFFTVNGTSKTPFRQAKLTKNLAGDLGAIDKSLATIGYTRDAQNRLSLVFSGSSPVMLLSGGQSRMLTDGEKAGISMMPGDAFRVDSWEIAFTDSAPAGSA
jgi:hypothetical protein